MKNKWKVLDEKFSRAIAVIISFRWRNYSALLSLIYNDSTYYISQSFMHILQQYVVAAVIVVVVLSFDVATFK